MVPTRRRSIALFTSLTVAAAAPAVAVASSGHDGRGGGHHDSNGPGRDDAKPSPSPSASPSVTPSPTPETIALPNGFSPEGIASGLGGQLFAGSLSTGAVYRADARTGQGAVLVPPQAGRISQGLKVAGKALVVAGGTTGHAYVYNAKTGANVADLTLTTGNGQINDVAIGAGAAWFTDSRQQQLYRVSVGGKGGKHDRGNHRGGGDWRSKADSALSRLSFGAGHGIAKGKKAKDKARGASDATLTATTIPITGDLAYDADPATFEANGIEVLNRSGDLLIVQSRTGKLFKVDGDTGVSKEVPLTGGDLLQGDGILLKGDTLYVVKNRVNQIAVVKLDKRADSGVVERTITSPLFRVPTTVARIGHDLFAVNARFGTPSTPETDYDIVRVPAK